MPGVSNQSGQDDAGVGVGGNVSFSMNGGRTEYNNWELDSGDNMDNGSNTTLNVYPSLDAIAEVRVLTSNYGAQYGRNGSGTVEVKPSRVPVRFMATPTNLSATIFSTPPHFQTTVPEYKKNDFGYTIGGPVFIPGVYNRKPTRLSSSGRRSGGGIVSPDRISTRLFLRWRNEVGTLLMFAPGPTARLIRGRVLHLTEAWDRSLWIPVPYLFSA